jgi:hypothetical protein
VHFSRAAIGRLVLALGVAAAVALAGTPAQAATSRASDDAISGVLARIGQTGTLSAADRAILNTQPEVAAQVVVPSEVEVVDVAAEPALAGASASGCTYADRYVNYPSTFHATKVTWHVRVDWCYNGKTVYNIRHYDYMGEDGGGVADYKGMQINSLTYPGKVHYEANLAKQAHIQFCVVKYGCYANMYPYQRFTLGNNGSYRVEQKK